MSSRMIGTVVRLIEDKKFGFIKLDNGKEAFFHMSDCTHNTPFENLTKGATVSCEYDPDAPKGPRAALVELV